MSYDPDDVPHRLSTIHTETLGDEVCLYEWSTHGVHTLNATAARVWTLCDGTTSVARIAHALRAEFGPNAEAVVDLTIAELKNAGLLEPRAAANTRGVSRRHLVKRLGLTAAMWPVVSSIVAPSALEAQSGNIRTFTFAGASETFVVPPLVTQITVDAFGAAGGATTEATMAPGGRVRATISVTPGETLLVNVGGTGRAAAGGFNGGGGGGYGGGGASDLRRGATKLIVAGGGGGRGTIILPAAIVPGGMGGGLTGGDGSTAGGYPGLGGSQTAGGLAGAGVLGVSGTPGSAGLGGNGAGGATGGCGGGGGGYFGGGGGGTTDTRMGNVPSSGAGGGGSSYTDPPATGVVHTQGVVPGDGHVTITW